MNVAQILIQIFVLLFAITIHEASHGWAAYKMGDPTAYALGRVTLNPIVHIDPIGTILFPLILFVMGAPPFGWAKPVPVNPMNLRDPRRDNLIISAAGPLSNFSVAFIALLCIKLFKVMNPTLFLTYSGRLGPAEGIFMILYYTVLINVILAVFNLIPIPPLDGSGVLMGLISDEAAEKYDQIRPYGFFILLVLIMTGFIGKILGVIMNFVNIFIF